MPKRKTPPVEEAGALLDANTEPATEVNPEIGGETVPETAAEAFGGISPEVNAPSVPEDGAAAFADYAEPDLPVVGDLLLETTPDETIDDGDAPEALATESKPLSPVGNDTVEGTYESKSQMAAVELELPAAAFDLAEVGAGDIAAGVHVGEAAGDVDAEEDEEDFIPPYGEGNPERDGDASAVLQSSADSGGSLQRRPRRRAAQVTQAIAERERKKSNTPDPLDAEGAKNEPTRPRFYELDLHELDRDLTPEQRKEWNAIYASYRGRNVMTGTVSGVDPQVIYIRDKATNRRVRQEMLCAVVIPFRVRILIPATEMWIGEPKPEYVLKNISGATIEFVVVHVDREAGFAIGSRRLAMRNRRYFFASQPSMHEVGSRIKCRVLNVGPRRCLVESNGYDIDLTQREMRYTAIPDLRTEYFRGQELDCIVKSYDRKEGALMVSVKETQPNPFDGAKFRHPVMSRRQAVIAGKYAGGVFCNLPDGVVIMCSYSFQYEDSDFTIMDKVIVLIQKYDFEKKQIYGKIVARW